jgi:hypothetical protein
VLGLTAQSGRLSGLWELAQSASWALPHSDICWVSERHHILRRDDRGRPHCEIGPACAYPHGWAIYAIHGVRVPEHVIERPQEITVEEIDNEWNTEIRRVMIERCGASMHDAGGERLDHDERYGTLWRRSFPRDEPIVMVEVVIPRPSRTACGSATGCACRRTWRRRRRPWRGRSGIPRKSTIQSGRRDPICLGSGRYRRRSMMRNGSRLAVSDADRRHAP